MVEHPCSFSEFKIVTFLAIQPQQQGNFRRITYSFRLLTLSRFFKKSSGVSTNPFRNQSADIVICQFPTIFQTIEIGLVHLHQILCQRTGLVCTNHGNRPHCFASVHLTHQIVSGKHTAHIQCQAEGHTHRQSLGNGNHNQGNRHHEIFQCTLQHRQPVMPTVQSPKIEIQYNVFYKENKESKSGYGKTDLTDQVTNLVSWIFNGVGSVVCSVL